MVVIELRVPYDGFVLPTGSVDVDIRGSRSRQGIVLEEESTPGALTEGTFARLAIELQRSPEDLRQWPAGSDVEIFWCSTDSGIHYLRFQVPPA